MEKGTDETSEKTRSESAQIVREPIVASNPDSRKSEEDVVVLSSRVSLSLSRSIESPVGGFFFAHVQGHMPRAEHASYCVYPFGPAVITRRRLTKAPRRVYASRPSVGPSRETNLSLIYQRRHIYTYIVYIYIYIHIGNTIEAENREYA